MATRKTYAVKSSLSKFNLEIIEIIGKESLSFEDIRARLSAKGVKTSSLAALVDKMAKTGWLHENRYTGKYSKGMSAPNLIKCLGPSCGKVFESQGINNRLCPRCKEIVERMS